MRERDINTPKRDQLRFRVRFFLVLVNRISVLQYLRYSRDQWNNCLKLLPEIVDIHDLEEELCLCLLGESATKNNESAQVQR